MTINGHANGLKVPHADKDIVDDFFQCTKDTYEDITKLNPKRGRIYNYISMTLYYTTSGEMRFYRK